MVTMVDKNLFRMAAEEKSQLESAAVAGRRCPSAGNHRSSRDRDLGNSGYMALALKASVAGTMTHKVHRLIAADNNSSAMVKADRH